MKPTRILILLLFVVLAPDIFGQSLWLTLRPCRQEALTMVDSTGAEVATQSHTEYRTDTTALQPYFAPSREAYPDINTLPFMINFKPLPGKIEFKSAHTPQAIRDTFLTSTHKRPIEIDLSDPLGLSPIDRAKYEYIKSHPADVHYSWNTIPDPNKAIREGQRLSNSGSGGKELSKLFRPDDSFYYDKRIREKEKEKEGPWKLSGEENLQFSQLFVENWIKGGERSASLLHDLRAKLLYAQGRNQWETTLRSKLGLTYTTEAGTRVSDDEFNLNSKYGLNAVNKWYYSFLLTFKTQIFKNYSGSGENAVVKSKFLSPAEIQFNFGMDYKRNNMSLLLSPLTSIITVVSDTVLVNPQNYGIEAGKRNKAVRGVSVTYNWVHEIVYGVKYTAKAELFYEYKGSNGNKRFDWESIIDMQINRYLSTRLLFQIRYFDNESDKFQFKENFSIAFKYAF